MRIADVDHLPAHRCADTVGDDAVGRKVAAPDHVARACRRKPHSAAREEALPITMGGDLRTALARRIRIIAQERLILAVAPRPLLILIDLIRRHHECRTNGVRCADTFKDIDCPHHICRERLHGLAVTRPHNRLRREVKDDLRPRRGKRASKCIGIAHIAAQIAQLLQNAKPTERLPSALRRRIECKSCHLCPRPEEQEGKPHALKACMSREEDTLSPIETQIFHNIFPLTHSFPHDRFFAITVRIFCKLRRYSCGLRMAMTV